MRHISKLTALAFCAVLVLSGCAENKVPADSVTTPETTASAVTTVQTEKAATTTSAEKTAAMTTSAASAETEPTETTAAETTAAVTTITSETTLGGKVVSETSSQTTIAESTVEESTADNSASTDELEPPPEIDKNMFTLYLGGNTTPEKYDVKIDSLPADIVGEFVRTLPENGVIVTADKNGKYSISDEKAYLQPDAELIEQMLSRENFEAIRPKLVGPDAENMTYEEFRERTIDSLDEMLYPGLKDMFDSDGSLNIKTEYCEIIGISYRNEGRSGGIFAEETVIKEGIKAAFDSLASDKKYKELISDAKKNNKQIKTYVNISYSGSYKLDYSCAAYYNKSEKLSETEGSVYLGKAKIYETAPDTPTHYVIPADSSLLQRINTDDNPYEMSVDIVADGYYGDNIYIKQSGYSNVMRNDAILGVIPEIVISGFGTEKNEKLKQTWVRFRIKEGYRDNVLGTYAAEEPQLEGIGRFNIFMYFKDGNMTLPIQTYYDNDTYTVYTVTDAVGTYCLYDLEMWLDLLCIPVE